jgi:predicted Fe-Mo cluster-binding NifX family protein
MTEKVKVVYVGRHKLLPAQEKALLNGLNFEVVKTIENLPTEPAALNALIQQLKSEGIQAVVTVALPPHLLASLSAALKVYVFEMKSHTVSTIEEAEKFVAENPSARTYLPGRPGEPIRVLEFNAINEVKVVIESKRVWPPT